MSVTRILTFTSLYPSSNQPSHGVFVEQRLRHLVAGGEVEAKVVAPVPWFPWSSPLFGKYADYAGVPYQENLHGIDVRHPRYPVIPKVGMLVAPLLMVASLKHVLKELLSDGFDFDLLDAHFLYPDGVAAILLGRLFGRPVVLTARGTDVHTYLDDRLIRPIILWAVRNAARTITVSEALRKMLLAAGIAPDAVVSLRNGVDLNLFQRGDKALNRSALGINGRTVLSVGNLRKVKGHDLVIEAISMMEDVNLIVIGAGEEDQALRALVDKLGLGNRVRFIQPVSHRKLREYYVAADALVLASEKEGWPNVLLESMACGTPVLASNVGGIPEIVGAPAAGRLLNERSATGICDGLSRLFETSCEPAATRRYAEQFDWSETIRGQMMVFESILSTLTSGATLGQVPKHDG